MAHSLPHLPVFKMVVMSPELAEQAGNLLRHDASAKVQDMDHDKSLFDVVAGLDLDLAILSKLERIFHQVDQYLLETSSVPNKAWQGLLNSNFALNCPWWHLSALIVILDWQPDATVSELHDLDAL